MGVVGETQKVTLVYFIPRKNGGRGRPKTFRLFGLGPALPGSPKFFGDFYAPNRTQDSLSSKTDMVEFVGS